MDSLCSIGPWQCLNRANAMQGADGPDRLPDPKAVTGGLILGRQDFAGYGHSNRLLKPSHKPTRKFDVVGVKLTIWRDDQFRDVRSLERVLVVPIVNF